ncbi:MAG TPA: hypothetical protein V6D18_14310 [Thermosynechococcaceae cyanobacterium]
MLTSFNCESRQSSAIAPHNRIRERRVRLPNYPDRLYMGQVQ